MLITLLYLKKVEIKLTKKTSFQPIIKWSGSKRKIASDILSLAPKNYKTYYEPFVGGGSMLYMIDAKKRIASDINKPLIDLWNLIKNDPDHLLNTYKTYWQLLNDENNPNSYQTFYNIREEFNSTYKPEDLFFLSRTCVNGLIRFNKKGEFNNSLHYTRKGINPDKLEKILQSWNERIKDVNFLHLNYYDILSLVKKGDFLYLDPPYFNTKGMYYGSINADMFLSFLEKLNQKGVMFILSFDGKTCAKDYTFDLPKELYIRHQYIYTGKSTFKKVIDKTSNHVHESIYMNY